MDDDILNNTRPSMAKKLIKVRLLISKIDPTRSRNNTLNIVNDIAKNLHNHHANDMSHPQHEEAEVHGVPQEMQTGRPIMGKNALMARVNALGNNNNVVYEDNCDVRIIRELVEGRFQETLNYFRQKSLKRRQARSVRNTTSPESKFPDEAFHYPEEPKQDVEKAVSLNCTDEHEYQSANDDSIALEYNSEDFLKEALGDDMFITCNSTMLSQDLVSII